MLSFGLGRMQLAECELHSFAKADSTEDYDAVPRKRSTESPELSSVASVLQKAASNTTQLLLIFMVIGLVFHFATYISSLLVAKAPSAFVSMPALTALLSQPITAVPQIAAIPANDEIATVSQIAAHEITTMQTSRYNKNYYCSVKSTRWTGPSSLSIDFIVVGDRSLGDLQEPMASTVRWPGGSAKPKTHTYEVDDLKQEFVEGTLFYEGLPRDKTLDFEFGNSGYTWIKLTPREVKSVTAPQQAVAVPSVAHEITTIQTSRYLNSVPYPPRDYYCTVKRTRWTGVSLAIDFALVGDRTFSDVQEPMASILSWPGGSAKPQRHTYEVDDLKSEFVEGTLFFEGVPSKAMLDFEFGGGHFGWVKLTPLKVEVSPTLSPSSDPSNYPSASWPWGYTHYRK